MAAPVVCRQEAGEKGDADCRRAVASETGEVAQPRSTHVRRAERLLATAGENAGLRRWLEENRPATCR